MREREKRQRDPQRAERQRRALLLNQYGLTPEDYARFSANQGLVCAICGTHKPGNGHKQLLVDHDHASGRVRGLLCNACNRGLGDFHDDPELLQAAIAYLLKPLGLADRLGPL
jgi:Recombination endonuclease VII